MSPGWDGNAPLVLEHGTLRSSRENTFAFGPAMVTGI